MGRPKILAINVVTDSRRGVAGLDKTGAAAGRMGRTVNRAGKIGAAGLVALGAAALSAAKAAASDEASQSRLANTLRKNAGATDKSVAATERWIDKTSRAKGVADDQLRPALAALVRANGSVEKSQQSLNLAMDIAADTGKPLSAVSAALAKAYGGYTAALGKLVPGMDKAILKSGDMTKIQAELARMTGGAASKAAQTQEGKLRRTTIAAGELQEKLGSALLPAIGALVTGLTASVAFLDKNSRAALIVAAVLGGLAVTVITINAAYRAYQATLLAVEVVKKLSVISTAAQTAAQYALGTAWLVGRVAALAYATSIRLITAAMKANPIGMIITALTIVGGLFVLAYKKSATFRAIVQAAGKAGSAAVGWIVSKVSSLVGWFGKLGPAVQKGKNIAVAAMKLYLTPIQKVIDLIQKLVGWIKNIKFPKVPKAISKLGGLFGGGGDVSTPTAPGGSVPAQGRGGPGGGGFAISSGGGSGYGNTYIYVTGALDPMAVGEQLDTILTRRDRRLGRLATG